MQSDLDCRYCIAAPTSSSISLATSCSVSSFDHFSQTCWLGRLSPLSPYMFENFNNLIGSTSVNNFFGLDNLNANTVVEKNNNNSLWIPQQTAEGCQQQVVPLHQLLQAYSCSVPYNQSLLIKQRMQWELYANHTYVTYVTSLLKMHYDKLLKMICASNLTMLTKIEDKN